MCDLGIPPDSRSLLYASSDFSAHTQRIDLVDSWFARAETLESMEVICGCILASCAEGVALCYSALVRLFPVLNVVHNKLTARRSIRMWDGIVVLPLRSTVLRYWYFHGGAKRWFGNRQYTRFSAGPSTYSSKIMTKHHTKCVITLYNITKRQTIHSWHLASTSSNSSANWRASNSRCFSSTIVMQ